MGQEEEPDLNTQPDASVKDVKESAENMDIQDTSAVGKVRALMGMLTKFMGVKDIVSLRISLPASLLDPVSNLEYWTYMDRPDLFVQIPDSEEPIDRMLNVIKWWYSKETKWMTNKIAKPYNSILGEQFICHWNVEPSNSTVKPATEIPVSQSLLHAYHRPISSATIDTKSVNDARDFRVYWVNEQISHRPPVSCFYYYNKDKGISCRGVDHMGAKFTGTSVKIFPGSLNGGLFLNLENRGNEEYNLTHPSGLVNGFLKASLWISIGDETIISCPKTGLRAILEYKDEPMFARAKYAVQGKIYKYDPKLDASLQYKKLAKVPDAETLCHISGCWKGQIFYKKTKLAMSAGSDVKKSTNSMESDASFHTAQTKASASNQVYPISDSLTLLLDMAQSVPYPKQLPPLEDQGEWESRKIWQKVTENIIKSNFNEATVLKREIEDAQRKREKDGAAEGHHYKSVWFGFLDKKAVEPSICKEDDLVDDGTMSDPNMLTGKPFLLKSMEKELPWNKLGSMVSLAPLKEKEAEN